MSVESFEVRAGPDPQPDVAGAGVESDLVSWPLQGVSADLVRVRDRIRRDEAAGGYRPLPGQMVRIAALRRRERALIQELERRQRVREDTV